jgi:hypothetical protein
MNLNKKENNNDNIIIILNQMNKTYFLFVFTSTPSLKKRCRGYRFGLN